MATTTSSVGTPDVVIEEPPRAKHARLPSDVLRAVVALALLAIGFFIASVFDEASAGVTIDTIGLVGRVPRPVVVTVLVAVQVLALVLPVLIAVVLLRNRTYRRLLLVAFATAAAAIAAWGLEAELAARFSPMLDVPVPDWICAVGGEGRVIFGDCVEGLGFPPGAYIAGFAAAFSVVVPWVTRSWRVAGWTMIALFVVVRSIDGVQAPFDALLLVALGYGIGAATLLLFGAPDRRPRAAEVADALARSGIAVASIEAQPSSRGGARRYRARTRDGQALSIEIRGPEEQAAAVLVDLQRSIRLTGLGNRHPRFSHRRAIEAEAIASLKAQSDGVCTPSLVAVTEAGVGSMLVAYEHHDREQLHDVGVDVLSERVLGRVWDQVGVLRANRMAHGNLRLTNVEIDDDGEVWLVGFEAAKLAAEDGELRSDVVELLLAMSLRVGPRPAVASAQTVLGVEALADAAPRLQPMAVSSTLRGELDAAEGLVGAVQDEVKGATGIDDIEFEKIERVNRKTVLTALGIGAAFYFLIPQLAQIDLSQVVGAEWEWFVFVMLASVVTYMGAAWSLMGSVPDRVPFLSSLYAQVAASFVNRITPAKVGGMAMNVRFLQKLGLGTPVAVTGVGISNVGGVVVHIVLLLVFATATGRSAAASITLPSGTAVLVGLTAVLTLAGLFMLLPWGRKVFLRGVWPIVREAGGGVAQVGRNPWRVLQIFGGSFLTTMAYIFALWYSLQAFGGGLGFFAVGTVFLAGSAVAQAAPTPGGIGAAEAAFIAGLTAFGLAAEVAVPAVFMYRFATFWLPILPGWAAFQKLQTDGAI